MRDELAQKSRALARVLRHRPEQWGVKLDRAGWCSVEKLLAGAAANGAELTRAELQEIVETNNKARYTFSPDGLRIRAAQGHSVSVDLGLKAQRPPAVLYHGTVAKFLPSIEKQGLLPLRRHAVHLSETAKAAEIVARRRGGPVILLINAAAMYAAGERFERAENGVWLVASVPTRFITHQG